MNGVALHMEDLASEAGRLSYAVDELLVLVSRHVDEGSLSRLDRRVLARCREIADQARAGHGR